LNSTDQHNLGVVFDYLNRFRDGWLARFDASIIATAAATFGSIFSPQKGSQQSSKGKKASR
jgi:hypothetical protein